MTQQYKELHALHSISQNPRARSPQRWNAEPGAYHGAGGLDEELLLGLELLHHRQRSQQVDVVLRLCGTCNTTAAKTTSIRTLSLTKKKDEQGTGSILSEWAAVSTMVTG